MANHTKGTRERGSQVDAEADLRPPRTREPHTCTYQLPCERRNNKVRPWELSQWVDHPVRPTQRLIGKWAHNCCPTWRQLRTYPRSGSPTTRAPLSVTTSARPPGAWRRYKPVHLPRVARVAWHGAGKAGNGTTTRCERCLSNNSPRTGLTCSLMSPATTMKRRSSPGFRRPDRASITIS